MSEGKLRRRIKEIFPILDPEMNVSDTRRVELLNLVDEAKKEFPQCLICKFLDCYFIHQRSSYYSLCPPRKEWFLKYFGDKE